MTAEQLVLEAERLLKPNFAKQGVELRAEPCEPIVLRVDPQQIKQVLINLAQNAADSAGKDGRVLLLRARKGMARLAGGTTPVAILEVSDTGDGIPPEAEAACSIRFSQPKKAARGWVCRSRRGLIADLEPELFKQAIALAQGNQAKAARWLGVTRLKMREKLIEFGLHPGRNENASRLPKTE